MATVLVAEDDADIRNLLYVFLSEQGHRVVAAPDGQEAYNLAVKIHPDVLITDVMMPRKNGYQLVHDLTSEHDELAPPKIIILTSRNEPRDVELGLNVGADVYVNKPFDLNEVAAHVQALIAERAAEGREAGKESGT